MNKNAARVISIAQRELGVTEMPPNSNKVQYNTMYYGREVSGSAYPWCVVFIWYIFNKAKLSDLFYGGGKTASCTTLNSYHKRRGQAVEIEDIQPGDIVFFDFSGKRAKTEHVGLCVYRYADHIVTIDGNTGTTNEANGGAVMQRDRLEKYVSAAYRPAYPEEEEEMTQDQFDKMLNNWLDRQMEKAPGAWSEEARNWAEDNKIIIGGYNGNMMYNSFCTREQIVQMLYRALHK